MKAIVNKIIKFSNVDGPGNRIAIFLQECNMHCRYCHNPETINICNNCGLCVNTCPAKAISLENARIVWNKELCIDCDACVKSCNHFSSPKTESYSVQELLNEVKKVLKEDGLLYITTTPKEQSIGDPHHFYEWSLDEFKDFMKLNGFKVVGKPYIKNVRIYAVFKKHNSRS